MREWKRDKRGREIAPCLLLAQLNGYSELSTNIRFVTISARYSLDAETHVHNWNEQPTNNNSNNAACEQQRRKVNSIVKQKHHTDSKNKCLVDNENDGKSKKFFYRLWPCIKINFNENIELLTIKDNNFQSRAHTSTLLRNVWQYLICTQNKNLLARASKHVRHLNVICLLGKRGSFCYACWAQRITTAQRFNLCVLYCFCCYWK